MEWGANGPVAGVSGFSIKVQIKVLTLHTFYSSALAALKQPDSTVGNDCGFGPVKLYLQKQAAPSEFASGDNFANPAFLSCGENAVS